MSRESAAATNTTRHRVLIVDDEDGPRQSLRIVFKDLYDVVLAAQQAAVATVRPGVAIEEVHKTATRRLTEGLIDLDDAALVPGITASGTNDVGGISGERLKSFIERIERLEEEKAALASDIRDVYSEAKAKGFDTKILRKIVGIRKKDHAERQEEEAILDLYLTALGMA